MLPRRGEGPSPLEKDGPSDAMSVQAQHSDYTPDLDFCEPEWGYALALSVKIRTLTEAMPV